MVDNGNGKLWLPVAMLGNDQQLLTNNDTCLLMTYTNGEGKVAMINND